MYMVLKYVFICKVRFLTQFQQKKGLYTVTKSCITPLFGIYTKDIFFFYGVKAILCIISSQMSVLFKMTCEPWDLTRILNDMLWVEQCSPTYQNQYKSVLLNP